MLFDALPITSELPATTLVEKFVMPKAAPKVKVGYTSVIETEAFARAFGYYDRWKLAQK